MQSSTSTWRRLYVRPDDLKLCISTHVVGYNSHIQLFEVAVHPQVPITHPYQHLFNTSPICIDSLAPATGVNGSWQNVQVQALYKFITQAERGITMFGTQIGAYYRDHYPKLRPWIEYLVLEHDLPKSDKQPRRKNRTVLADFSRAVVFLALTVADPEDATTKRIRSMDEFQIIETLRNTLDKEFQMLYRQSDANLNIIGLIRHVLVQSGGAQNLAQLDLLNDKWRDIHSPAVFAALMGVSQKSVPDEWTSHLSESTWRSLRALWNDALDLHRSLQQPHNAERLFSVWAYLVRRTHPGAKYHIEKSTESISSAAIWSLASPQAVPAQIVLDLMTVVSISRLFPKETSSRKRSSSIEAFNDMLTENCRENMLDPLNRMLSALHRVFSAENFPLRDRRLACFLAQIEPPNLLLDLNEALADQYFADRVLNSTGHGEAFGRICGRTGSFPVKLAPLKLSESNADPEETRI
ncbi:hypothetical protein FPRO04_06147 [Fusarium proliferatum]|nr:hypothetical protein FPRO04_06147 [Fusarium proliferatum]